MSKKIKIGYFIDVNFNRGGAPISTRVLAEGIAQKDDYECSIIKPKCSIGKENEIENVNIISIDNFNDTFPFMLFHPFKWINMCKKIEENIKKESYSIIHAQMPFVGMGIGLLKKLKLISNDICLIYTDREHVSDLKWYHKIRYRFFIAKEYNQIITISDRSKRYWEKITNEKKVNRIYNTATKSYETTNNSVTEDDNLNVLFAGRIAKDKNWPLAVDIVKKFTNLNSNVRFVIVLSFFDEEQKIRANEIEQQLKHIKNVKIIYNLNEEQIKEQYEKADIFVMTSSREAFGRTAVEAMSQKTVVIGTNIGGIPEVIKKSDNILNIDADEFVKRINFYNKNRNILKEDKETFYTRYKENFSVEINISKHDELYKKIWRI